MPINREKELLFIHVPKTGGSKIELILGMKFGGDDPRVSVEKLFGFVQIEDRRGNGHWYDSDGALVISRRREGTFNARSLYELQHLTYRQILDLPVEVDRALFNKCYKFAFVRNPLDKVVSLYFWMGYKYFSRFEDFVEFLYRKEGKPDVRGTVENYMSFDWLVNSPFTTPQHKFICNNRGKLMVDFLGRFEDFSTDLATLLDNLNVEYDEEFLLEKVNATKHKKYTTYYNKKTRDMVKSIYKRDFEIFGYE